MNRNYIYVASPYSHPDEEVMAFRVRQVQHYCSLLFLKNIPCYSPIAHWAPIAKLCGLGHGIDLYWTQDEALIKGAKALHVLQLDGWTQSVGIKREIACAQDNGIPIVYIEG
jgi:hypothetical protein